MGESILPILGWLMALVLAGGIVIYFVRRWMKHEASNPVGFTLGDLREMLEAGLITEVEFQAAKDAMIEQVKKHSAKRAADNVANASAKAKYTQRNGA